MRYFNLARVFLSSGAKLNRCLTRVVCAGVFRPEVLVTLTADFGKIMSQTHRIKPSGELDFVNALKVAKVRRAHELQASCLRLACLRGDELRPPCRPSSRVHFCHRASIRHHLAGAPWATPRSLACTAAAAAFRKPRRREGSLGIWFSSSWAACLSALGDKQTLPKQNRGASGPATCTDGTGMSWSCSLPWPSRPAKLAVV